MKVCPLLLVSTFILQTLHAFAFVPSSSTAILQKPARAFLKMSNDEQQGKSVETDDDGLIVEDGDGGRRDLVINVVAAGLLAAVGVASAQLFLTSAYTPSGFQRLPSTQFIAALGDPNASQGTGAQEWGLWRADPGPRGVWLRDYERTLEQNDGIAPVGWKFDKNDWWLEEHGIIMESPKFPMPPGRYLVTGGRMVTTGLTIEKDGSWKLDEGKLYDVTHLPCRSARYQPTDDGGSPKTANQRDFPVAPGAEMPNVSGCNKQDYAVLFLVGKAN